MCKFEYIKSTTTGKKSIREKSKFSLEKRNRVIGSYTRIENHTYKK